MDIFIDTFLPLLLIVIAIIFAVFLYKKLRKTYFKASSPSVKKNSTPQVKLKGSFVTEQEMTFLEALHKSLPRDCISFPNVGVSRLIEPKGNLVDYHAVMDKFVDIVVFLRKDMTPILVIDLFDPSPIAQQLKKFDDNVNAVLKEVKIPVLHKQIEQKYDTENLKMEILKSLSNTIVAYLKDKTIKSNEPIQK